MLGAKPENFVLCLTFCDILNDETIGRFLEELKECEDLEMVKEIKEVTYTSFPNFEECDNDKALNVYLKKKTKNSRCRVFESVISHRRSKNDKEEKRKRETSSGHIL